MEKSSAIVKVPPLTAVYDVPTVAALNSVSSNPAGYTRRNITTKRERGGGGDGRVERGQ
jgi:hypothetical protein